MLKSLRDQPPPSTLEWIIVFIGAKIPRYIGEAAATRSGLGDWPAFAVGCTVMVASIFGYFVIRRFLLSD